MNVCSLFVPWPDVGYVIIIFLLFLFLVFDAHGEQTWNATFGKSLRLFLDITIWIAGTSSLYGREIGYYRKSDDLCGMALNRTGNSEFQFMVAWRQGIVLQDKIKYYDRYHTHDRMRFIEALYDRGLEAHRLSS